MLRVIWMYFLFCLLSCSLFAQQLHHLSTAELVERQFIDEEHADRFATIQVQDFQGRIKPIHTLSLELLRKIYGKSYFRYVTENGEEKKLSATQVFLGMQLRPDSWQLLPCIKINGEMVLLVQDLIEVNENGYASVSSFFDFTGEYKIQKYVTEAYKKSPKDRDAFDKDIIKIDERVNILWGIFNGQFLKVFPNKTAANNTWFAPSDNSTDFSNEDSLFFDKIIPTYFLQLEEGVKHGNWDKANDTVDLIKEFQTIHGHEIINKEAKVNLEVWYNNTPLFLYCLISYTIFGVILLVLSFVQVFTNQRYRLVKRGIKLLTLVLIITFMIQVTGIGFRWYISGHAPWSNGYEATVFISWISVLAGIVFSKRNVFVLPASAILAICLLGISHGSLMNPEITNLVPVLKSYWLLIHVAVITASYGFLGLGSLLSLIYLILYGFQSIKISVLAIRKATEELTVISQLANTVGLYMLTIGTFLGGIWANESWGRYWGWDPKETWALISIIIYSFVLHIRIMIPNRYAYFYNVCSLFAIASIIMTFFGVNYYLSGLHSYAKGDSFPIPNWVYVAIVICVFISLLPLVLRLIIRNSNSSYGKLAKLSESV